MSSYKFIAKYLGLLFLGVVCRIIIPERYPIDLLTIFLFILAIIFGIAFFTFLRINEKNEFKKK